MRRFALLVILTLCAALSSARAATLYDWNVSSGLYPDQVATSTGGGAVTVVDNATPENPTLGGGMLQLSTDQYVENMYYNVPLTTAGNGAALGTLPLSIEFSLKMVTSGRSDTRRAGFTVALTAGNNVGNGLQIHTNEFFVSSAEFTRGATTSADTTNAFHTFRIDVGGYAAGSAFSVYFDNALSFTGSLYSSSADNGGANIGVYFGEASSLAFGTSQLQSFRITTVPEPSTWALTGVVLAAGGFATLARRACHRSSSGV